MPLFVVLLSRIILKERQTWSVYLSLLPIIVGVFIATVTELLFDLTGLLCALLSTFLFSLQNIFSKKVLKEHDIHHLRLLQVLAKLALCLFLPFWVLFDGISFFFSGSIKGVSLTGNLIFLAVADGFFAFAQNMVAFTMLSLVSPVSYSVANASKRIFVIASSILLLRNPVSLSNAAGMTIAILGVFLYNKAKFDQRTQKQVATVLPFKFQEVSLLKIGQGVDEDRFPIIVVPSPPTTNVPSWSAKTDQTLLSNGLPPSPVKQGWPIPSGQPHSQQQFNWHQQDDKVWI